MMNQSKINNDAFFISNKGKLDHQPQDCFDVGIYACNSCVSDMMIGSVQKM